MPRLSLAALAFYLVAVDDGIVKAVASGVFNIRVGPDHLPEMYSWIAILFCVTMIVLSWLTTRIQRHRLVMSLFFLLAIVLGINTVALIGAQSAANPVGDRFYSFLFVSSELIRNIAGFQVWIVAGGICFASRAKVLFPLLAASTTLGDISGGFLVGALGRLDWASWQIYGLAAVNTLIVIGLLRPLMRRYFVTPAGESSGGAASMRQNLDYFARSSYLRALFVLSLVLFALYTAIHYGFNVVARESFADEAQITGYFGAFFAIAGLATMLTTTFLLRHVLRWLGVGNVYLWVCIIHAVAAALLIGAFGQVVPLPVLAVIFAINLLNYVLLDAVIAPTYQVLMKLVPDRNADGVRMIMEGGFMLFGGLLGAGVTALHAQSVLTLSQLFTGLALASMLMAWVGWRLRQSHRQVLIQAVKDQDFDVEDEQAMQAMRQVVAESVEFPRSLLLHADDGVREMGIEILRQNEQVAAQVCDPLIDHDNPRIRSAALRSLGASTVDAGILDRALLHLDDEDEEVRLSTARWLSQLVSACDLEDTQHQRVIAAVSQRLVPDAGNASLQSEFLVILERLGDEDSSTARGLMLEGLIGSEQVDDIAAGIDVALRTGQAGTYLLGIRDHLDHHHPAVREAAVRTLIADAEDGTRLLVDMLADPDRDVVEAAVTTLSERRAQDGENGGQALLMALETASVKQWDGLSSVLSQGDDDMVATLLPATRRRLLEAHRSRVVIELLLAAGQDEETRLLRDQLTLATDSARESAMRLLGQLGDVDVVADLVDRMGEDDAQARENAIELLENIGNRELLEPLLPLLIDDEEEQSQRAWALSGWRDVSPPLDLDHALGHVLEGPDPWTKMAAAWTAFRLGRSHVLNRMSEGDHGDIPPQVREIMEQMSESQRDETGDQPLTNMEKITFLKGSPFFAALPLEELYHIALSVQEEAVKAATHVIEQGSLGDKMYIVVAGQLEVRSFGDGDEEGTRVAILSDKQVFGDMSLLDDEPRSASVIADGDCRLLSLQRSDLERILRRYSSIAFSMMRILSRRLRGAIAA
ncbi:MAG: cyclic nucleotide-binding domain-containing protein [Gemmatimonadetes bacterium]|nr:cyclic nucleotide-binding domain-containing protein [Gemmatimonadota bacterium]MBT7862290.1 cyclic nucleotide-binding domain-containing protein [Gemmatimonadota bacterium]